MLALPLSPFLRYNPKLPRRAIDPKEVSVCDNSEIFNGCLLKSCGHTELTNITLDGPARHIREHVTNDGTRFFCILTVAKFWVYNTSTGVLSDYTRNADPYGGSFQWSSCSYGDLFIFSNGVDEVQKWDGASTNKAVDLATAMSERPLLVMTFGSHLLFLNDQAAADKVNRKKLMWSVPGIPADFSGAGSGSATVYEGIGEIKAVKMLSRETIGVYKSDSVHLLEYVGGTQYFVVRSGFTGIGVDSRDAVVNIDGFHVALTNNGLRKFDGASIVPFLPEITPILTQYYPNNNSKFTQLLYDAYNNKLWIFLPKSGSSWECSTALVYSFKDASWSRQSDFSTYAVCTGNVATSTGVRWMDLPVPWNSAGGLFWGGQSIASRYRVVIGDTVDSVYQEDELSNVRQGNGYQATAETLLVHPGFLLFQHPTVNTELVQIDIGLLMGNPSISIGVSDRGDESITWHGPYVPDANGHIYKMLVGRWFIFRIRDTNPFSVFAITPWFVKRGVV